eukprot:CAMPEP_0177317874 /NCGR_PEP_ID=MMETSP0368-20130122/13770_1 /TAXON_ID=447022 ORGANISM="Scrippsiella hangoei-like, Strain SHHI-4" /NCGR_SAMPLE_ID=MMETSP0368 /ASSEMBLY_ACC=CAM_ASM_000363 /LENGTH=41 /DNA_ID= /DNA_START= /DNA_END= /DNA_ORIENTATION=
MEQPRVVRSTVRSPLVLCLSASLIREPGGALSRLLILAFAV